jgi:hypothetical protein
MPVWVWEGPKVVDVVVIVVVLILVVVATTVVVVAALLLVPETIFIRRLVVRQYWVFKLKWRSIHTRDTNADIVAVFHDTAVRPNGGIPSIKLSQGDIIFGKKVRAAVSFLNEVVFIA